MKKRKFIFCAPEKHWHSVVWEKRNEMSRFLWRRPLVQSYARLTLRCELREIECLGRKWKCASNDTIPNNIGHRKNRAATETTSDCGNGHMRLMNDEFRCKCRTRPWKLPNSFSFSANPFLWQILRNFYFRLPEHIVHCVVVLYIHLPFPCETTVEFSLLVSTVVSRLRLTQTHTKYIFWHCSSKFRSHIDVKHSMNGRHGQSWWTLSLSLPHSQSVSRYICWRWVMLYAVAVTWFIV